MDDKDYKEKYSQYGKHIADAKKDFNDLQTKAYEKFSSHMYKYSTAYLDEYMRELHYAEEQLKKKIESLRNEYKKILTVE